MSLEDEKTRITNAPTDGLVLSGRYAILDSIGRGGMGNVFRAKHLDLDKLVAVKVLHSQLVMDELVIQRFKHEMKAMSLLSHPNLIAIYDCGTTPECTPYLVMEYLEGETLAQLLKENERLSPSHAKQLFLQIADALAFAHSKGVIHRDLKPSNIVITRVRDREVVKVVDLGIAKIIAPDPESQKRLTQTGEVFGSPLYMSPEQCTGTAFDARADIYSLGCMLYEALTGVPPIFGATAIETLMAHMTVEAKPFSQIAPGLEHSPLLSHLEKVTLRCLKKDPSQRYSSMDELIEALNAEPGTREADSVAQGTGPSSSSFGAGCAKRSTNNEAGPSSSKPVPSGQTGFSASQMKLLASFAVLFALIVIGGGMMFLAGRMTAPQTTTSGNAPSIGSPVVNAAPFNNQVLPASKLYEVAFPANNDPADVCVFSVYMGDRPEHDRTNYEMPGTVDINVSREGKPIVLVVNAYMPVTWRIRRQNERVNIQKVIAVGYKPQKVEGLPTSIPVDKSYYVYFTEDGATSPTRTHTNTYEPFYFLFGDDSIQQSTAFKDMQSIIEKGTGMSLSSFTGSYTAKSFELK